MGGDVDESLQGRVVMEMKLTGWVQFVSPAHLYIVSDFGGLVISLEHCKSERKELISME